MIKNLPSREKLLDSLFMTNAAINSKKLMKSVPLLETDLFLQIPENGREISDLQKI